MKTILSHRQKLLLAFGAYDQLPHFQKAIAGPVLAPLLSVVSDLLALIEDQPQGSSDGTAKS